MADKLTESLWTAFTKKAKLDLDDGALVKALAKFDKTDEAKPEPRLAALEEVIDQTKKQVAAITKRKKELGDKPFGEIKDKLYLVLDLAETLQKQTQAAASSSDDEEADTPALLTTKMIPLVRELRKGQVRMNSLICTAGKNTAVLIMRRSISPTKRKLLADAVDAKGGMKYIAGEVLFENKALTFVVQSPAAGLAKRLRQALLDQLQLRLKVKVRGEDGAEELDGEDEDEQVESEGDEGAKPGASSSSTTTASAPGNIPPAPPLPGSQQPGSQKPAYEQLFKQVDERAQQALRDQHPEATKIRALLAYAQEKADEKQDYAAAIKGLETLDKLIGAGAKKPAGNADEAMADWQAKRNAAVAKLKEVAGQIAAAKHPSSAKAILEINAVMKNLTAAPSTQQQVKELQNWLGSDDVVNDVCELAEDIRTPLLASLSKLQPMLTA